MEILSFAHEGQAIHVTVSLGVSGNDPAVDDYQKLIARADEALYRSKREGRNRFSLTITPTGHRPAAK
jgi:diguanylate cyclase (GGDEF)-like protein